MPRKRVVYMLAVLLVLLLPLYAAIAEGENDAETGATETVEQADAASADEAESVDAGTDGGEATPAGESGGLIALRVETAEGVNDGDTDEVEVALTMENCAGVDSLQLNLNYDANALKVKRVLAGDVFPAQYVVTNYDRAGLIGVACAGLDAADGGTVLTVTFVMLNQSGGALTITDAEATRYTPETGQIYAYLTVENGGISGLNGLPAPAVTPWSPPTPTPSPTPEPTPTIEPTPIMIADEATPELSPTVTPVISDPQKLLPIVIAAGAILLCAAVAIVVIASMQSKKKKKKHRRKKNRAVSR